MSERAIVRVEVDCHAYPWHLVDEEYPECGPENLTRMAEEYGVMVRHLPDHALAHWADWYAIAGPVANIAQMLGCEYGDPSTSREIAEAGTPTTAAEVAEEWRTGVEVGR